MMKYQVLPEQQEDRKFCRAELAYKKEKGVEDIQKNIKKNDKIFD